MERDDAYCRDCGYWLKGMSREGCPECGRPFNWGSPRSVTRHPQLLRWARKCRLLFLIMLPFMIILGGGIAVGEWYYYRVYMLWERFGANPTLAPDGDVGPFGERYAYAYGFGWEIMVIGGQAGDGVLWPILDEFGDDDVWLIAGMPGVTTLRLIDTKITDAAISDIATLSNLRTLDLPGADITDEAMPAIATLSNLEVLNLSNTNITDVGLRHLSKLRKLQALDIQGTKVRGPGLAALFDLPALEYVECDATMDGDMLKHLASIAPERLIVVAGRSLVAGIDWPLDVDIDIDVDDSGGDPINILQQREYLESIGSIDIGSVAILSADESNMDYFMWYSFYEMPDGTCIAFDANSIIQGEKGMGFGSPARWSAQKKTNLKTVDASLYTPTDGGTDIRIGVGTAYARHLLQGQGIATEWIPPGGAVIIDGPERSLEYYRGVLMCRLPDRRLINIVSHYTQRGSGRMWVISGIYQSTGGSGKELRLLEIDNPKTTVLEVIDLEAYKFRVEGGYALKAIVLFILVGVLILAYVMIRSRKRGQPGARG